MTTQHERDEETGLDYRGARFYDADVGRFLSVDPLARDFASWSAYNYVLGNPVSLIDPDGRAPEWIPSITEKGQLYYIAEKGDKISTLNNGAHKYVAAGFSLDASFEPGYELPFNSSNVYSEGTSFYYNDFLEGDGSYSKNGRCHSIALCGSRGQSVIDFEEGSLMNNFDASVRDKVVEKQYDEITSTEGNFDFQGQGVVGETILTFKGHTAVYFGTSKDGTNYFLSKNNASEYSIDTFETLEKGWGKAGKAYNIKPEYKNQELTDDDL